MTTEEIESISSESEWNSNNDIMTPKKENEFDNINVVVRVRPIDKDNNCLLNEKKQDQSSLFPAQGQIQVKDPQSNEDKLFTFNVVFEPEASQMDIFEHSNIKRIIDMALEGFYCTVFAYGQTGSGKTYTLSGTMNEKDKTKKDHTVGLIQLSFAYLFEQIKIKRQMNISYVVTASYLEIYNEQVLDLLNPSGKALQIRWNKIRGFYAENLFKVECEDVGDLQGVLEEGMKNRQFRSHEMNEHSSRSHTLLTIALYSSIKDPDDNQNSFTRQGRLCLVDLAGSEKTKRTKATKETLVEANRINTSLLALGNCISSLASAKKRTGHIPYRDSTLTKLLADSLSGSGLTLMISCISPNLSDAAETISTLRYAARAKKVKTNPVIKMDPRELHILSLKRELRLLRMENGYLREKMNLSNVNLSKEILHRQNTPNIIKNIIVDNNTELSTDNIVEKELNINQAKNKSKDQIKNTDQIIAKYMQENKGLRTENSQLHLQSQQLREYLEEMSRENERLKRKVEFNINQNKILCETKSNNLKNETINELNESKNNTYKLKKIILNNSNVNNKQITNDKYNGSIQNKVNLFKDNLSSKLELIGISAISQSKIRKHN